MVCYLLILIYILFVGHYYVTWGGRPDSTGGGGAVGAPIPPQGKAMGKLSADDLTAVAEKGLLQYSKSSY